MKSASHCVLLALILSSCADSDFDGASADANSEADRKEFSTPCPKLSLDEVHAARLLIDEKFLAPALPDADAKRRRVVRVSETAVLTFDDESQGRMNGVSCTVDGLVYIRKLLLREDSEVVVSLELGNSSVQTIDEIFLVDQQSESKKNSGIGFTRILESAVLSGWCEPAPESSARIEALGEVARSARCSGN